MRLYSGVVGAPGSTDPLCRIPAQLADDKFHSLAVTITARTADLYMDCEKIYQCRLPSEMLSMLQRKGLSVWIGQRHRNANLIATGESSAPFKASHAAPMHNFI